MTRDPHQMEGFFKGLTNYRVPIPGADATCYIGRWDKRPDIWVYSLWTGEGIEDDTELISSGELTIDHLRVAAEQVARIAFLLDVEYAGK